MTRIAVVGTGIMGLDHLKRLSTKIAGAEVTAIVEPNAERAEAAREFAPQASVYADFEAALAAGGFDAVLIATPGPAHEPVLLPALAAGLFIFCEKPLTPTSESSLRIHQQERANPRIQMGFMRRFDREYQQLKQIIQSRELGELLMIHAVHRNATAAFPGPEMLITDSAVHEIDVLPWLVDSRVKTIEVLQPKPSRHSSISDPQIVVMQLENGVLVDVEINVNCRFGYQVRTEAVFEEGVVMIGGERGPEFTRKDHLGRLVPPDYRERFAQAYDDEIQAWVDACRQGKVIAPTSWDGYLAAAVCEAGLLSQRTGQKVEVAYA